jgi:alpha-beta hydrolase superfamily lysophospholipase
MNKKFAASISKRWLRRPLALVVAACLTGMLAVAGCSSLAEKEREMVFRVVEGDASWYGGLPEGMSEARLKVITDDDGDGTGKEQHINTWWWPADDPAAPTVLYLHGSRWNLTGQLFRIEQLHAFGFSVLAIDYRGFGRSDGKLPSEKTVYEDADAAWQRLLQLQPDPAKRYIYGHSLGGAVAIDLAARLATRPAQDNAHGLIVESSFTSLAQIAKSLSYDWLPIQLLLSQKFDSIDKIASVNVPVLFVHGTNDRYVATRFSEELYAAAPSKKRLLLIEGATHNNSMRVGTAAYRQAFRELFGLAPSPS